jgi:hypothetical protein
VITKNLGCRLTDVPGVVQIIVQPEAETEAARGLISVQQLDGDVTVLTSEQAEELANALHYAATAARDIG